MLTHLKFSAELNGVSASPFCLKVDILLAMSGLQYTAVLGPDALMNAPKGKLPVMKDGEELIADSEFIKKYLETKYNADFSGGYSEAELAVAHAFTRMAEHSLYFVTVCTRWLPDENFAVIEREFFGILPAEMRSKFAGEARENVRLKTAKQGYGQHTKEECLALGHDDLQAISTQLGAKPYLMGATPCFADAAVGAQVLCALSDMPNSSWKETVEQFPNLVAYANRLKKAYPVGAMAAA
ncbi:glutathione S-transferase family protein [Pseudovibrio sp. Tun.PSC04-5.I4]|uniref:glutathione S-transferase family protein n=1 Tax=Pseudovibrio sp. Tun.PSC04-5.I4 TaxID=1798213 RepID=UPI00088E9336|nr:glutathione S-transferase family protein [Pseudovibrio sp. Tun.PSC04-5.I4]SDR33558.1 Glutathione S-transferase [Pseudovibrio sp. Tun.PSC04-5.I4]